MILIHDICAAQLDWWGTLRKCETHQKPTFVCEKNQRIIKYLFRNSKETAARGEKDDCSKFLCEIILCPFWIFFSCICWSHLIPSGLEAKNFPISTVLCCVSRARHIDEWLFVTIVQWSLHIYSVFNSVMYTLFSYVQLRVKPEKIRKKLNLFSPPVELNFSRTVYTNRVFFGRKPQEFDRSIISCVLIGNWY